MLKKQKIEYHSVKDEYASENPNGSDRNDDLESENDVIKFETYSSGKKRHFYTIDESRCQDQDGNLYFFNAHSRIELACSNVLLIKDNPPEGLIPIELTVLGGRFLRHFLGKQQPKLYSARDEKGNFYAVSSAIQNMIERDPSDEKFYEENSNSGLVLPGWELNPIFFNKPNKPVVGLTAAILFSFFLSDGDIQNIGFVEEKYIKRAFRYDTAFCFAKDFWRSKVNWILEGLQFLSNPDFSKLDRKKLSPTCKDFFSQIFDGTIFDADEHDNLNPNGKWRSILCSEWTTFECYAALCRLFERGYTDYHSLIDKSLSDCVPNFKERLKSEFVNRLNLFKQAACQLPNFEDFYKEYNNPSSNPSIFWHAFFDEKSELTNKFQPPSNCTATTLSIVPTTYQMALSNTSTVHKQPELNRESKRKTSKSCFFSDVNRNLNTEANEENHTDKKYKSK